MILYGQAGGELFRNGHFVGIGYSGLAEGLNNSSFQDVRGMGPIPRGLYAVGEWFDHPHLGPCVAVLTPVDHDALRRTELFIHGAHMNDEHDSSNGCIVVGPRERHELRDSGDKELRVI